MDEPFSWPVRCGCGRVHGPDEWRAMPWVGTMDDGEDGFLALRNCPCGSTRAVPLLEDPSASKRARD